jgi:ABC-type sugar transport system substrate-binding protein
VTLGSLGNPFFGALAKGAEAKAKEINPNAKVTTVSADYDLGKQFSQIDNFIAAGVDVILLNAADAKAIAPAVKRAQAAGIAVVGVDVAAVGATRWSRRTTSRPARSPASTWSRRSAARATSSSRTARRSRPWSTG